MSGTKSNEEIYGSNSLQKACDGWQYDEDQHKFESSSKHLEFIPQANRKQSCVCFPEETLADSTGFNVIETQTKFSTNDSNEVDVTELVTKRENLIREIGLRYIVCRLDSSSRNSESSDCQINDASTKCPTSSVKLSKTDNSNCKISDAVKGKLKTTFLTGNQILSGKADDVMGANTSDVKLSANYRTSSDVKFVKNPSNFSRAITARKYQQNCSSHIPFLLKDHQRSSHKSEPRYSIMQVIQNDQPLELRDSCQASHRAPPMQQQPLVVANREKNSKFWMKTGDFLLSFDIYYVEPEKLRLQSETLCKESGSNQKVCFGIDNYKFSTQQTSERESRLSSPRLLSHYWFAAGDVTIQFNGKRLSGPKIKSVFRFLNASAVETGVISFGVDEVEFSKTMELISNTPNLSMRSGCSQRISLQWSSENGLERRRKNSLSQKPNVAESRETTITEEHNGLLPSSFKSNKLSPPNWDCDQITTCIGDVSGDAKQSIFPICKRVAAEKKVERKNPLVLDKTIQTTQDASILKTLSAVKRTQKYLRCIQRHLNDYINICNCSSSTLRNMGFLPNSERILAEDDNMNKTSDLCECSKDELEICMYSLICYVNASLSDCMNQMDTVLHVLYGN